MKVAFLIGQDDASTRLSIARVCSIEGVEPAAVLIDSARPSLRQRWKNLRRNVRREGIPYVFRRGLVAMADRFSMWADEVIPRAEVDALLESAFEDSSLRGLQRRYGFLVAEAGNLNGPNAVERLRASGAELGIVLGTRVLKRPLFSTPRLGCINLHKGKVPEYRGMPPGFWELYEGEARAGVTVHFIDDGLDTGDIVETGEIPIHPKETPESLRAKLHEEGSRVLMRAVDQIRQGTAVRRRQPVVGGKSRTRPTRVQEIELQRRLPHWRRPRVGREALKNLVWLATFHSGLYRFIRWTRRGSSRGAILLYHRVNDVSVDVLTASRRRFAEHLIAIRKYYQPMATWEAVKSLARRGKIQATSVAIHFDDCYKDVRTDAGPLLAAAGMDATAFLSSGFIDTERVFEHDREKYPHRFENLSTTEIVELAGFGIDVAAHTVNHVDLGSVALEQARAEVVDSRKHLEAILGRPVALFSFPFGGVRNIREEVRQMVIDAGYEALFSAHGGYLGPDTELFDIPRFGVSSEHSPLALLMAIEGIFTARATRGR